MLEKVIQKTVIAYAMHHGVRHIRMYFGPGAQVGWLDVWFLIPGGRPLIMEFKATGKRPTKKQQHKITRLLSLEYDVFVCDDIEEGKKRIDLALNRAFGRSLK